jgi:hypothetical protein
MNLPLTPPTDNLYKFAALTGLVLLIGGLLYPVMELQGLVAKQSEVIRATRIASRVREDPQRVRVASATQTSAPATSPDVAVGLEGDDVIVKTEEYKFLVAEAKYYQRLGQASVVVGLLVSFGGFTLWYRRHQSIQDLLLQEQLREIRAKTSSASGILNPPNN